MTDSQYRWVIVAYTLVIQAVSLGILVYSFALFAVPWLDEFGVPRTEVMLTGSLLQFSVGLFSPMAGRAMDRYPMHWLVLLGLGSLVCGLLLVAQARELWQIQILYATIFPVALALMGSLAGQTLVTRWFADKRGFAIGLSATGTNIGGIVFPLLAAGWLLAFGWRDTFLWLALVAVVVVAPLTWAVLRRPPPGIVYANTTGSSEGRLWATNEILGTRLFWLPVLCILPLTIAFSGVQLNLGAFSRDLGLSGDTAAMLLALSSACMILGKFFFGGLGDRLDHRMLFWIAASFMISAMFILQSSPSLELVVVGVAFVGLAGGGILPLMGLIFSSRFGIASFGRVMGFVMMSFTLGATGPLLAGWAYDVSGSYNPAFIGFGLSLLPAVVAMRWLPSVDQRTA